MSGALRLPAFFSLVDLDTIGSTNEEALRLARSGAPEGTLVWARQQTGGRGRRGRAWSSPPGNLYCSLLLRPDVAPAQAAQLGFLTAVAIVEAIQPLLPASRRLRCKWPNDLLIDGAKFVGILLETEGEARGPLETPGEARAVRALVLGMGVNIESFPAGTPYRATSLRAAGAEVTVEALLESLAERLLAWYRRWQGEGFASVRSRWLDFAEGLGRPIEVRLEGATLQGRFAALDGTGALDLELPDGRHRLVTAGDVFYPAA